MMNMTISDLSFDLFKGLLDGLSEAYTYDNDSENVFRNVMVLSETMKYIGCENYIQSIELQAMISEYLEEEKDISAKYNTFIRTNPNIKIDAFGSGNFN